MAAPCGNVNFDVALTRSPEPAAGELRGCGGLSACEARTDFEGALNRTCLLRQISSVNNVTSRLISAPAEICKGVPWLQLHSCRI